MNATCGGKVSETLCYCPFEHPLFAKHSARSLLIIYILPHSSQYETVVSIISILEIRILMVEGESDRPLSESEQDRLAEKARLASNPTFSAARLEWCPNIIEGFLV